MPYRIKAQDIAMADAMPFCQHHEVRVRIPLAEALSSEMLFLDVRSNLRPGDRVYVTYFDDGVPAEEAELRILSSSATGVTFGIKGEIQRYTVDAQVETSPDETVAELLVKRGRPGEFKVEDPAGNTLEIFKTKAAAQEYADTYGASAA